MNPKVDWYFEKAEAFKKDLAKLRNICLETGLDEVLKWGQPTYQHNGKNIVLLHTFRDYFALMFFKGALIKDTAKLLVKATENMQASRQLRFHNSAELSKNAKLIKQYIFEAVEIEKSGLKPKMKTTADYPVPEELTLAFKKNKALKTAFEKLTPGRQRGYLLHFAAAKQSTTRAARIDKLTPAIMAGKGWNE